MSGFWENSSITHSVIVTLAKAEVTVATDVVTSRENVFISRSSNRTVTLREFLG